MKTILIVIMSILCIQGFCNINDGSLDIMILASVLVERNGDLGYVAPKGMNVVGVSFDRNKKSNIQYIPIEEARKLMRQKIYKLLILISKDTVSNGLSNIRKSVLISYIYPMGWKKYKTSPVYKLLIKEAYNEVSTIINESVCVKLWKEHPNKSVLLW